MKLLFASIVGAVTATASFAQSTSAPSAVADSQLESTPEKLKGDLDFLFRTIDEVHVNPYAYTSKKEFDTYREALYREIDRPLTPIAFYKLVAPVVAKLKNGHTSIYPLSDAYSDYVRAGGKVFPLEIDWDGRTAIIRDNHGSVPVPKGSTILSIDGEAIDQVFARLCRRFPAEGKDHSFMVVTYRQFLPMFIWTEYGAIDSLTLRVKEVLGGIRNYDVTFVKRQDLERTVGRESRPQDKWSFHTLDGTRVGLLELNVFDNPHEFKPFLKQMFSRLRKDGITDLIIDIRNNPGGTDQASSLLLGYLIDKPRPQCTVCKIKVSAQLRTRQSWWDAEWAKLSPEQRPRDGDVLTLTGDQLGPSVKPNGERFAGRVFVLIGPQSASTSMEFAALVRSSRCGTLIGQETADPISLYADSMSFRMPNTGLPFVVAAKYFLHADGLPGDRGVSPHHEVTQSEKDRAAGVDTVLKYTLGLIEKTPLDGAPRSSSKPASGSSPAATAPANPADRAFDSPSQASFNVG